MGRSKKDPKEALIDIPCKISPAVADEIYDIAETTDRSRSQVARKLITRGLAAYKRDGLFDDPEAEKPPTVTKSAPKPRRTDEAIRNAFLDGNPSKNKGKAKPRKLSKATEKAVREALENDDGQELPEE